jgi:plasmid stabilization system protein ParE
MKIKFAQEARTEFASNIRRYAREAGAAQAKAFRAEIHHMNTLIAAHPDMGAPTVDGCRYMVLDRFPFSIIYRHAADTLIIIAIAHHSRCPGYWAGRR